MCFLTRIVPDKIFNDLGQRCRYAFFVHNKVSKLLQKAKIVQPKCVGKVK